MSMFKKDAIVSDGDMKKKDNHNDNQNEKSICNRNLQREEKEECHAIVKVSELNNHNHNEEYHSDHEICEDKIIADECSLSDNKENKKIHSSKTKEETSDVSIDFGSSHSKYMKLEDKVAMDLNEYSRLANIQAVDDVFEENGEKIPITEVMESYVENDETKLSKEFVLDSIDIPVETPEENISKLLTEILEIVVKECEIIKCDVCDLSFESNHDLNLHIKIHPKPFKCRICNKFYATNSHLKRHSTSHSGNRPYKCEVCGKDFTQSSNLIRHSRTHKEKTYKWTVCHKLFKTSCYSQVHTRSNTGERTYKCKACNKDFPHSVRLIRHTKVHTLKKPINFGGKSNSNKDLDDGSTLGIKPSQIIDKIKDDVCQTVLAPDKADFDSDLTNVVSNTTDLLHAPTDLVVNTL